VEVSRSLTPQVNFLNAGVVPRESLCFTCKGDRFFDERAKFLCLWHCGYDVLLFGIDERRCEVAQERNAMLGRAAQFTMCF
jgi:hypothetical protein